MQDIRVLICGINGAMGREVLECAKDIRGVTIAAGYDKEVPSQKYDFPVYNSINDINVSIDAVIDFSHYSATMEIARFCEMQLLPLVSATTGIDESTEQYLKNISKIIPVFRSKNFSYGISVIKKLVREAAKLLAGDFDIEIMESHHKYKADAPSGTAQMLIESVKEGANFNYQIKYGKQGSNCRRTDDEITVHSIRGGTIVGDHSVLFAGEDELITISHSATSKKVFAMGAWKALLFVMTKEKGYYSMDDLTGMDK